jgi:membrane dipeptidase
MKPDSRTLLARMESAGPGVARALEIEEGDKVVHWQRLRLADGTPMCLEDAYLADSIVPKFLDQPLPSSLYQELHRRDLMPTWGEDSVDAATARREEADLLGITEGTPVLRIARQHRRRGVPLDLPGRPVHPLGATRASQRARVPRQMTAPRVPVLDGHNDLPWALREHCGYDLTKVDLAGGEPAVHTDLPRLRAGGVTGQFWSVFVPCSLDGDAAVTATLEQVDFVHRLVDAFPDNLALCRTAADVDAATAGGRIASLMGMEGGHSINSSLGTLRMMHALGVRYMTLTHNENVPWADSATDEPVLGGLSGFGRDVVREMNRIGMFVDLSHVSADVMRDALEVTSAPVIFSHSSAFEVCKHPRNVPDDVLSRLAGNGGVCLVTFVPPFVDQGHADWFFGCLDVVRERGGDPRRFEEVDPVLRERLPLAPPMPGVSVVADHVEHVREVAGVEHVGIGGDYDGSVTFPAGLEDVSGYPRLFDELRGRGWSEEDLRALGSGNVLRAMRDMESVAVS